MRGRCRNLGRSDLERYRPGAASGWMSTPRTWPVRMASNVWLSSSGRGGIKSVSVASMTLPRLSTMKAGPHAAQAGGAYRNRCGAAAHHLQAFAFGSERWQRKIDKSRRKCCYGLTRPAVTASCQKNPGVFQRVTAGSLSTQADSRHAHD